MRLFDADALHDWLDSYAKHGIDYHLRRNARDLMKHVDEQPTVLNCAADNPHGLVPSKCPTCGEALVPYPCMDLAQDSYRDGILYGQEHPEWRADG